MSWSLNEVEALSRKAAKGAGMSWGQADEAGRAVRWLEARGLDGVAELVTVLQAWDQNPAPADCPISRGIALLDGVSDPSFDPADAPLLMHPFAAWAGVYESDLPAGFRSNAGQEALEILTGFAHRTYAPATEESRALGAGSELSDND